LQAQPTGAFGRGLLFMVVGAFVLWLIVSKRWTSVYAAARGKGSTLPGHGKVGKKK
jgi:hypothetical protein